MALATVIRLEFAYPGVGILAGDSIQYLSIATAHGVIMVFFMIMPAIFGAFGNFLLPTQLGVHDVAFPRLNSAAFWFLPGGLLMLCQLVCVDRRYQRMNCFNIRELQGILKRKFFPDLINLNDHRYLMDSSMIGLRFKYNNNDMVRPEQSLFYNFGTTGVDKQKTTQLVNYMYLTENSPHHSTTSTALNQLMVAFTSITNTPTSTIVTKNPLNIYLNELYNLLPNSPLKSIPTLIETVPNVKYLLLQGLPKLPNMSNKALLNGNIIQPTLNINAVTNTQNYSFSTGSVNSKTADSSLLTMSSENTNSVRYNKYNNALVGYDYKSGHYLGIWDQLYPSLTTSFIEVSRSIRKAPWFFSDQFTDLLKTNYNSFYTKFTNKLNLKLSDVDNWYSSHVNPTDSYFNLFFFFKKNEGFVNLRWVSINSLDQKFYKMFNSSSTQQRILANWRNLKFSREAWRCKLLVSRHQNTLYRRFFSEENLVYSIERNTKDLLPGWAMVTPFSARTRFTAVGKTDIGLMGVFLALNASIVSSANFLVTYRYLSTLNNRKMRDARSFFSEGLITAS
jgi:hypothetical protein